ncbi:TPA: hypothetical protein ACIJRN_003900 [Klebsiella aerogenes]
MAWNIPEKQKLIDVSPVAWGKMTLFFIGSLISIAVACVSWYYFTHDANSVLYALILCASNLAILLLFAGWRSFQLGICLEKNAVIKAENAALDKIYSAWASEYISIVDYHFMFPEQAQVENLKQGGEIHIIGQQPVMFPVNVDYNTLFYELLSPLRSVLITLAKKNKLKVVFPMGMPLDTAAWQSFTLAWRKLGMQEESIQTPAWMMTHYAEQIDEWLNYTDNNFRLIITFDPLVSLVGNGANSASDGVCAWLCAPPATDKNEQLKEKIRIYRAMATNSAELTQDLSDVLNFQSSTGIIEKIWIGKLKNQAALGQAIKILNANNGEEKVRHHFTEFILGRQGRNNMWAALSLSLASSGDNGSVNLIVSEDEAGIVLSKIKILGKRDAKI